MLREIIEVKSESYKIHIPKEYIGKKIEILVLPFFEEECEKGNKKEDLVKKTSGLFKDKIIDPLKWQKAIRSEW